MKLIKLLAFSLLLIGTVVYSQSWISRCESLHGQGRSYTKEINQRCSLVFEKLNHDALNSFPKN